MKLLLIGIGGFLGALSRFGVSHLMRPLLDGSFPFPTITVNLLGCFLLGLLVRSSEGGAISEGLMAFLAIGYLGAFTTFSAFGLESLELLQGGKPGVALLYVTLSYVSAIGACWLGWSIKSIWI